MEDEHKIFHIGRTKLLFCHFSLSILLLYFLPSLFTIIRINVFYHWRFWGHPHPWLGLPDQRSRSLEPKPLFYILTSGYYSHSDALGPHKSSSSETLFLVSGKTAMAATIGIESEFPYVKIVSCFNMFLELLLRFYFLINSYFFK